MSERTIRGDKIVKGQNGQYILNPKVTGRVLEGNIFLPPDGSQVAPIEVELELTEQQYNQFRNDVTYAPNLIPITEAGKFAITAGTIDPRNGQVLNSTFGIGVDERSKELTKLLADSSREIINSTNTQFEIEGLINQSSAAVAPEAGNTSAANPVGTGAGTGGTPTTGTATAGPAAGTPPGGTGGTPVGGVTRGQASLTDNKVIRDKYKILTYPADMEETQDKIKFTVWKHKNRGILNGERGGERGGQQARILANNLNLLSSKPGSEMQNYEQVNSETVYLPVTKISDTNSVDWSEDSMNTLQRQLAQISLDFMQGNGSSAVDQMGQLLNYAKGTEFYDMALLYLAGQAVGVDGMIARGTGAIFNPNLELLFRGPQLRSFTFNFPMISRNAGDATSIKGIINYFKKYMAPRATENNVFLNSPFVFKIEYLAGNKEHPSLNKIKMCALQACSVDYTPMGSYMTFTDTTNTMFMYTMALQFKELHPIYDVDYGSHPIGY